MLGIRIAIVLVFILYQEAGGFTIGGHVESFRMRHMRHLLATKSGPGKRKTTTEVPNILKKFKEGTLSSEDNPREVKTMVVALEDEEEDELEAIIEEASSSYQEKIENIVTNIVKRERERLEAEKNDPSKGSLYIHMMRWSARRLEIILSSNDDADYPEGPPMNTIQVVHRSVYDELELRDEELDFTTSYELLVASPGVRDELHSDRDFISFRGFPVTIITTEEYKKKVEFKGTLIERDEEFVRISTKGRVTKIPRAICRSVSLPKSKVESTDLEMKKL
jgi:ribosome maturation factor RimP